MYSTKDKKINIEVIKSFDVAIMPFDWAIVNVPVDKTEAAALFKKMIDSPTTKSKILCLTRHKRKERLESIANLRFASASGWDYLDTVSVWYEKPSSCSNNGLLPISEAAHILFKGSAPDAKKTGWFSEESSNATTLWNVSSQKEEGGYTYFQKFSWEVNLLMMSLSAPLEHGRFSYTAPITAGEMESVHKFCKFFNIEAQIYVNSEEEAIELIKASEA